MSSVPIVKGRVSLDRHMFSLISEGEKVMHVDAETLHLTPDRILLLTTGNVLFTERMGKRDRIKSTMIFFDDLAWDNATHQLDKPDRTGNNKPYLLFDRDDYLRGYVDSVNMLMEQGLLNKALQQAKLQELLLYLNGRNPGLLANLRPASANRPEEERLRRVMEAHLSEQLTLPELAFLCHMSLPTFKRKFEQVYKESPARWLQIQRLRLAADKLRSKTAKPGEIYVEAGYENHSSFSKAFKQYFGVLPRDYAC
jgi:AraC-like DNA-binding protein